MVFNETDPQGDRRCLDAHGVQSRIWFISLFFLPWNLFGFLGISVDWKKILIDFLLELGGRSRDFQFQVPPGGLGWIEDRCKLED